MNYSLIYDILTKDENTFAPRPLSRTLLLRDNPKRYAVKFCRNVRMNKEKQVAGDAANKSNSLPESPEIDIQTGLARLGGNKKLLKTLLVELYQHCQTVPHEMRAALKNNDHELATYYAHTIKGIAGNLGANRLAASANDIEVILLQGSKNEVPMYLKKFDHAIYSLLAGLKEFVTAESLALKHKFENEKVDVAKVLTLLEDLAQYVQKRMPLQCNETLSQLNTAGVPDEYKSSIDTLHYYISAYKFEEAQSMLVTLLDTLSKN